MVSKISTLISIVLFFFISCDIERKKEVDLRDNNDVKELFLDNEIKMLNEILLFQDALVKKKFPHDSLSIAYLQYLNSHEFIANYSDYMDTLRLDYGALDTTLFNISNLELLNIIWEVECNNKLNSNNKVCTFNYNPAGPYFKLLERMKSDNQFIENYYTSFFQWGTIPPSIFAGFYKSKDYLDFTNETHRLFVAIHMISTVKSM